MSYRSHFLVMYGMEITKAVNNKEIISSPIDSTKGNPLLNPDMAIKNVTTAAMPKTEQARGFMMPWNFCSSVLALSFIKFSDINFIFNQLYS